jgi:hypothetical protein
VGLVHGSWTIGTSVHHGPASIFRPKTHQSSAYSRSRVLGRRPRAGKGECSTGDSMGRSPEAGRRRGSRAMEEGGGDRRHAMGVVSNAREEVRRMVWGEVR